MTDKVITFIGAGNMAKSLISGLIDDHYEKDKLWVCDLHQEKLVYHAEKLGIHATQDNLKAVALADVIVFAVKPKAMKEAVIPLASVVQQRKPLVISVAAGVQENRLQEWLGGHVAIVRCMPNTPALLRCGATGMHANAFVSEEQKNLAEEILRAVGLVVWASDESQIDIVTALSGSGPAYFFLMMEALEEGAIKLGMPESVARLLVMQTALGAARMALESEESVKELRRRVTSPGGTTEKAINLLENAKLRQIFHDALRAAKERAEEIGKSI